MPDETRIARRTFLTASAVSALVAGGGVAAWVLFRSMKPASDVAASSIVKVDLGRVSVDQQFTVMWREYPIGILRRSSDEIAKLAGRPPRNGRPVTTDWSQPPGLNESRLRSLRRDLFVFQRSCSWDHCVVFHSNANDWAPARLVCPCCGSSYDLSGRAFDGPAPYDLAIPPYRIDRSNVLIIGETPAWHNLTSDAGHRGYG